MAEVARIEGDLKVRGNVNATTMSIPNDTVVNADVNSSAAIAASKLIHQHVKTYADESDTTATDKTYVVHTVYGATGTVLGFECGAVVACVGAATLDVDLLKNGTSILDAAVRVDSGDAARAILTGTISSASLVVGDVLEIDFDTTAGGGTECKGMFGSVILSEDPA
jgi:hypothetical protein